MLVLLCLCRGTRLCGNAAGDFRLWRVHGAADLRPLQHAFVPAQVRKHTSAHVTAPSGASLRARLTGCNPPVGSPPTVHARGCMHSQQLELLTNLSLCASRAGTPLEEQICAGVTCTWRAHRSRDMCRRPPCPFRGAAESERQSRTLSYAKLALMISRSWLAHRYPSQYL